MKLSKGEMFLYAIGIGYVIALFFPLIKSLFSADKTCCHSTQRTDWVEVPMLTEE